MIDVSWAGYEATQGTFNSSWLSGLITYIQSYKTAGYKIALGLGLGNGFPSWVYGLTNGQYKDQSGAFSATPNFVFCPAVRAAVQTYLNSIVPAIAASVAVDYYRIAWTPGEFGLPNPSTANGSGNTTTYPAVCRGLDALAQGSGAGLPAGIGACPMPAWSPGKSTGLAAPFRSSSYAVVELVHRRRYQRPAMGNRRSPSRRMGRSFLTDHARQRCGAIPGNHPAERPFG